MLLPLRDVPGGKKFGKPKPHTASTDLFGASSPPLPQGHPARLIMDRIYAIGQEIRGIAAEAIYYGKHPEVDTDGGLHEGPGAPQEIREGDSTATGND